LCDRRLELLRHRLHEVFRLRDRYQVKQVLEAIEKLADVILAQKKAEEKAKEKADKPKKK
jgi:hypothetical protein